MCSAVTCAIPGGKRPSQVEENVASAEFPAISNETMAKIKDIYDERIKAQVHQRW